MTSKEDPTGVVRETSFSGKQDSSPPFSPVRLPQPSPCAPVDHRRRELLLKRVHDTLPVARRRVCTRLR
jgi:hypothetical protein